MTTGPYASPCLRFLYFLLVSAITSSLLGTSVSCTPDTRNKETNTPHPQQVTSAKQISFTPLRKQLLHLLSSAHGSYSIYIEDLTSNQTLGIQPDTPYPAWSLLKLIVLSTILNKIDQGGLSMEQITSAPAADQSSPPQFIDMANTSAEPTLHELLERLICYSDNAASFELAKHFNAEEFQQNLSHMGLPQAAVGEPRNTLPDISVRQFAHALRTLYLADYLSPTSSTFALQLMASSVYDSQINKALPEDIPVAHIVGFNADHGDFHDCGIVFLLDHPYILCVMSAHNTREEADQIISEISRLTYQYITRQD